MASIRDAFFNTLYQQIRLGADTYVVTPDLGAPSLDALRENDPDHYISVGIAEQSLISISAGLALAGKNVVAYGLNPFPITRAYDQIRSLLAEFSIPVTVCGLNTGFCSAESGYTHMALEDFAMVRALGNIHIFNPTDETIAQMLAEATVTCKEPRYIRFDKTLRGVLYQRDEIDFSVGFTTYGSSAAQIILISNGCYVRPLRALADEYAAKGIAVKCIDLYALPFNPIALKAEVSAGHQIITIEENALPGGLGSCILEFLSDQSLNIPVHRIGYDPQSEHFKVFTNQNYIAEHLGLDIAAVRHAINDSLAKERKE